MQYQYSVVLSQPSQGIMGSIATALN